MSVAMEINGVVNKCVGIGVVFCISRCWSCFSHVFRMVCKEEVKKHVVADIRSWRCHSLHNTKGLTTNFRR